MRYLLSAILLFCASSNLLAQNILKGKVVDNNKAALAYVIMSIATNDSNQKYIAKAFTDSSGAFVMNIKNKGTYVLSCLSPGYENVKQTVIIKDSITNLIIKVKAQLNKIDGITISAQLPTIVRKADRIIMKIENNPLATGKSAKEALALAPGVFVNNGVITINGNSGVRVMVNNKLLSLSGSDLTNYLTSLPAENIKSIEVIPHPPAEYDAEGTGGLINIILKKNLASGLNGNAYAAYKQGRYAGTNEGVQFNVKKGQWGGVFNYAFNTMKSYHDLDQKRDFPNDGIYNAQNRAQKHNHNHFLHAGLTYDINDDQYIALNYTFSGFQAKEHWQSLSQIIYPINSNENRKTKGIFPNIYDGIYNDIGINYRWTTDKKGSHFSFLSDFITNNSHTTNNVESSNYNFEDEFLNDTAFRNATPTDATIFTIEAKYNKVFDNLSTLSFGGKMSRTRINNYASFEYFDQHQWLDNGAQNFSYYYNEQIMAGFVNYNTTFLNMNLQVGLRGENTTFSGTLWQLHNNIKNKRNYFGLFPSLYLQKNMDTAGIHSLSFSYNRRLTRPDFDYLNPHIAYVDNYTSGLGNPYLNPQYSNAFEMNYTLKSKYNLSVNYTVTKDIINEVIRTNEINPQLMIQQPINSGNKHSFAATAFIPIALNKWWSSQNTIQYRYENISAPQYAIHRNIFYIQTNQEIGLPYHFKLTLNAYYMSSFIFANAMLKPIYAANIGIQKKVWQDRLVLKAGLDDIFKTKKVSGTFYYNQFDLLFTQSQQNRVFTLGIVYNFKLGKSFRAHHIERSNDDEQSRLGQ